MGSRHLLGLSIVGGVLGSTAPAQALAAETIVELSGEVPPGDDAFFTLPFEVPVGTVEIEIQHSSLTGQNILDWGLIGPNGFRGWGGGNQEPAVVTADAASRSYAPGELEPGTWEVLVGKARVDDTPALFEVTAILRDELTLPAQPERTPYQEAAPLSAEQRWFAGDFHVHSVQSGDARPDLDEVATFARGRGLDFVVITDHNVHTANDFFGEAQPEHPDLLFVPGVEFTTYAGHGNGIGATSWVDHRQDVDAAIEAYHQQGALFAINHPVLDLGPLCIGCAWEQDIDLSAVDAVEITNGGLEPFGAQFSDAAVEYWDGLCAMGFHVAAIGGSDDHKAGVDLNQFQSPIGDGTTMVYADGLSATSVLDAVRAGRTVVKLQGPEDPMAELLTSTELVGDTTAASQTDLSATITNGVGARVRFVHNGVAMDLVDIDADPFVHTLTVDAPATGQDRYRVEVFVDGRRRVVTSHVWVEFAEDPPGGSSSGGSSSTVGTDTGSGSTSASTDTMNAASTTSGDTETDGSAGSGSQSGDDGGCGCKTAEPEGRWSWWLLLGLFTLPRRRRY